MKRSVKCVQNIKNKSNPYILIITKSSVFHKLCGNSKLKPLFLKNRVTLTSRTIWRTKRNVKLLRLVAYSVDENVIVSLFMH